jgi:glycosyltransferase involved in cell wall biosynthesis
MNVGGTARYVSELVEKIPNSKLATGNVQGSELEDPCAEKLGVLRVPYMGRKVSPLNDFRAWLELRRIIRDLRPDIVHTHTFKAGLIGRLVPGKHKRVHTFHGHLFDDQSFSKFENLAITFVEKLLAKRTNLLISVGEKVGEELRNKKIGIKRNWISIAPGVKALPVVDKVVARQALGLAPTGLLFGWMARMADVKNPSLFLEVASQLPEINFVMAGGGDLLEQVKSTAPKNVNVIGWANAATFWSAVDCAISTSDNEGMPVALIEAQLAGVPIVATDVGSNREVVENKITGFITSKKLSDLIMAISYLKKNPELIKTMGSEARARAEKNFNLSKMISAHMVEYAKLS